MHIPKRKSVSLATKREREREGEGGRKGGREAERRSGANKCRR